MKVFVVALLAFATFGASAAAPRSDLSDEIESLFSLIKDNLPEKVSVTDKSVTIPDNDIETGTIVLNEFSITGLSSLDTTVDDAGTDTHVDYTGAFGDILAIVDLDLDLTGLIEANGNVRISIGLQQLGLGGSADLNDDATEVNDFDLLVTLGAADIQVTGVIDDDYSQQLSEELTAAVPEVVNEITKGIEEPFGRIVKFVLNLVLKLLD